jgi:DNA-binding PadR family transcriptional regulator
MSSELGKRLVRALLDTLILMELRNRPMSANEVFFFLHEKFDVWISAGTVYSCMYSMERDGLIKGTLVSKNRRGRIYTLTDKGKETINAVLNANKQIQHWILSVLQVSS